MADAELQTQYELTERAIRRLDAGDFRGAREDLVKLRDGILEVTRMWIAHKELLERMRDQGSPN